MKDAKALFNERLERVNKAIRLEIPDRVPICPFFASWVQRSEGGCYKDIYYDQEKAGAATVEFYKKNPMVDANYGVNGTSGKANELAESNMIDWPGRPGTIVDDYCSHQVLEREYMTQEEYPELLGNFTQFMLTKYIPRAYPALKAFAGINLAPTIVLNTSLLASLYSPQMQEAYATLAKIAAADAECAAITNKYAAQLTELGSPSMMTGAAEAPYDILGDYFRGTMGMFEDLTDEDMQEPMEEACYMFADQQIQQLQYFRYVDLPVRRVFFPLHKGMDGFMSEKQYERFYWKPLKKIIMALIDMDVTPYLYGEGRYDSRLEMLTDVPKGKVLYHFERVDMKRAKEIMSGRACIIGNLPISEIEFGKKENVINYTRKLLDECMPGGGYIFDFDGCLENAKQENLDAMFETLAKYGNY